jgi:hypothetical protein
MRWKIFQISVVLIFMFANIFFRWNIPPLAAGVMGGMLAYYLTGVVNALSRRRSLHSVGLGQGPEHGKSARLIRGGNSSLVA